MINVAIIGAAGLSGLELIHLFQKHPDVNLEVLTSSKYEGRDLGEIFPQFAGVSHVFSNHETDLSGCDVAFLAIPNKASLEIVPKLLNQGIRVVDLSGAYRLRDTTVFERYYKFSHSEADLLKEAVFGLPEYFKTSIAKARLVSNPGCYPTGALLGILPFGNLLSNLDRPPVIDAKSGVSGAGGRVEDDTINYVSVNENFKAYKVFQHQHLPEIQQYLEDLTPYRAGTVGDLIFTPHLLPLTRGILSTIYLHFKEAQSPEQVRANFALVAEQNPFFVFLPEEQFPDLSSVQNSNRCHIGLAHDQSRTNWIVITAIDNLVKGASGQAIQNMNLMFGCEETSALI
ncbi:MAG: N-acetyl-gamma-glutamyl-phosphate reductase [SAR324 cluster bacterium]|nr:N-acetyl-gamma-glutamyl-phosphate reductase [SAR324 cluster bacterium]